MFCAILEFLSSKIEIPFPIFLYLKILFSLYRHGTMISYSQLRQHGLKWAEGGAFLRKVSCIEWICAGAYIITVRSTNNWATMVANNSFKACTFDWLDNNHNLQISFHSPKLFIILINSGIMLSGIIESLCGTIFSSFSWIKSDSFGMNFIQLYTLVGINVPTKCWKSVSIYYIYVTI